MAADGIYGLPLYKHQQNLGRDLYGSESIETKRAYRFTQTYREAGSREREQLPTKDIMPGYFQYNGSRVRFEIMRASGNIHEETLVYDEATGFRNEDGSESKKVLLPGDNVTIRRLPDMSISELYASRSS